MVNPERSTYLEHLVHHVTELEASGVNEELQDRCRVVLLDFVGSLIAGRESYTRSVFARVADELSGYPQASILMTKRRTSLLNAAATNAATAHATELDDVHADVTGFHPGATVIPAVFAIAEESSLHGRDVIRAVLAGYEIGGRIGAAITPSHRSRGFHATGTIGTLAAAAGAASAMKLSPDAFVSALALATSLASGTFAVLADGTEGKHLHAAHAAMMGVYSALLAKHGLRGAAQALEAPEGFFKAFATDVDTERLFKPAAPPWEIERVFIKRFPCCAHAFGAIDLALELHRQVEPHEIDFVAIETYHAAAVLNDASPTTPSAAKFSLPYCFASALLDGKLTAEAFMAEAVNRPEVRAIAERVRVRESEQANVEFPQRRLTRVQLALSHQGERELVTFAPRGLPDNPLTYDEIQQKFRDFAGPLLGSQTAKLEAHVKEIVNRPAWVISLNDLLTYDHKHKEEVRPEQKA